MQLFDSKGRRYTARKVARPRFSSHRGRVWDYDPKTIDGRDHRFWSDTARGTQYYFEHDYAWYSMHFWKDNEDEATSVSVLFTVSPATTVKE